MGSWRVRVRPPASSGPRRGVSPGLAAAVFGSTALGLVCACAWAAEGALLGILIPVQVLLAMSWLAVLGAGSRVPGAVLAFGTAVAADLLLTRDDDDVVGSLAGVIAIGFVVAVLYQLASRRRTRVTEVLAAHVSAVLLVSAAACIVAVRGAPQGRDAALLTTLVLAVGSAVARLLALVVPARASVGRGGVALAVWASLGAGLGAAVLGNDGTLIGLGVGVAAGFADLVVTAAQAQRRALLFAALLPLATASPVAYVLSRVLLG